MSRHHPPATEGELDRLLLIVPVRPEPAWFAGPVADLGPRPPHVSAALLDGDDDDAPGSPGRAATLRRLGVPVRP